MKFTDYQKTALELAQAQNIGVKLVNPRMDIPNGSAWITTSAEVGSVSNGDYRVHHFGRMYPISKDNYIEDFNLAVAHATAAVIYEFTGARAKDLKDLILPGARAVVAAVEEKTQPPAPEVTEQAPPPPPPTTLAKTTEPQEEKRKRGRPAKKKETPELLKLKAEEAPPPPPPPAPAPTPAPETKGAADLLGGDEEPEDTRVFEIGKREHVEHLIETVLDIDIPRWKTDKEIAGIIKTKVLPKLGGVPFPALRGIVAEHLKANGLKK